jgi:hypothetical protein
MTTSRFFPRLAPGMALVGLLLVAPGVPATAAGGASKAKESSPVVRDHRDRIVRDHRGIKRTQRPRPQPICAGWAC